MGIFYESGMTDMRMEETLKHPEELMEAFIVDHVSRLPDELVQEFCEAGGVGEQLVQEGKLRSKNTIVRMAKKDDLQRRKVMTCLQLAKDNNDPNWKKLVINRQRKNDLKAKIVKRWSAQAERIAKKTQQEFLHGGAKGKGVLPAKFKKFGGDDRVSQDD